MKLFDYQNELIKDVRAGNSVICNWARGAGKTLMFAKILLDVRPKEVLFESSPIRMRELREKIDELIQLEKDTYENRISKYSSTNEKIELEFQNGEKVKIVSDRSMISKPDYVFYNKCRPFLKGELEQKFICMITQNNYKKELQKEFNCKINEVDIYDLVKEGLYDIEFVRENSLGKYFYDDWAIKSKKPDENNISLDDFKSQALQRLIRQFLNTSDTKDTVLTRKNILEMIKDLDQLGR